MHNADRFKALGDPIRLALLHLIAQYGGALSVDELVEKINTELHCTHRQPTISHHLGVLALVGFVEAECAGTYKYYRLKREAFLSILDTVMVLEQEAREEVLV